MKIMEVGKKKDRLTFEVDAALAYQFKWLVARRKESIKDVLGNYVLSYVQEHSKEDGINPFFALDIDKKALDEKDGPSV